MWKQTNHEYVNFYYSILICNIIKFILLTLTQDPYKFLETHSYCNCYYSISTYIILAVEYYKILPIVIVVLTIQYPFVMVFLLSLLFYKTTSLLFFFKTKIVLFQDFRIFYCKIYFPLSHILFLFHKYYIYICMYLFICCHYLHYFPKHGGFYL